MFFYKYLNKVFDLFLQYIDVCEVPRGTVLIYCKCYGSIGGPG